MPLSSHPKRKTATFGVVFFRGQPSEKPDNELVRLYQQDGRLDWLSALYLRYASMVYGVCLKYLKNREEAQDAVMQIYEELVTGLRRHEVAQFRGWLYVKARNHCLMKLRVRKHQPGEDINTFLMENGLAEHPEEEIMEARNPEKLQKCLQTLVEPQQLCITLFYLEEKCYREISAATGYDFNQVKSYIQNGKRNLKNCMESDGR